MVISSDFIRHTRPSDMLPPSSCDPAEADVGEGAAMHFDPHGNTLRKWGRLAEAWLDIRTLMRYLTVGGASALIEFTIFNALVYLAALDILPANLSATCVVIAFGFLSHKHFTFRCEGGYGRQLRLYLGMLAVSIFLNNALIFLFAGMLQWPPPLAKVLQLGICLVWNFSCSRLIVFAPRA